MTTHSQSDRSGSARMWIVRTTAKGIITGKEWTRVDVVEAPNAATAAARRMRRCSVLECREGVWLEVYPAEEPVGVWKAQYTNPEAETEQDHHLPDYGELVLTREDLGCPCVGTPDQEGCPHA